MTPDRKARQDEVGDALIGEVLRQLREKIQAALPGNAKLLVGKSLGQVLARKMLLSVPGEYGALMAYLAGKLSRAEVVKFTGVGEDVIVYFVEEMDAVAAAVRTVLADADTRKK